MKLISIIIPFKDRLGLLRKCIKSISEKTSYANYEIILVDNNSEKEKIERNHAEFSKNKKSRIISYPKPFNFSAINNLAAKNATGEFLLFLNDDTEVISENWLEELLKPFEDPNVGVVGAKLLYPDWTIQHAGVRVGKNIATHQFLGMKDEELGENNIVSRVDAVTGACMMTRKDLFLELGGFDEKNLSIAYNDVDYCLRLTEKGFKTIWTPEAKLFHHESATRGSDISILVRIFKRKRYKQFQKEQDYMRKRWQLS